MLKLGPTVVCTDYREIYDPRYWSIYPTKVIDFDRAQSFFGLAKIGSDATTMYLYRDVYDRDVAGCIVSS